MVVGAAGRASRPPSSELKPLEFTYIRIGQDQYATNLNPTYEGSVAYTHCLFNPNEYDLIAQNGCVVPGPFAGKRDEIFQVLGPTGASELRIVKSVDSGPDEFRVGFLAIYGKKCIETGISGIALAVRGHPRR